MSGSLNNAHLQAAEELELPLTPRSPRSPASESSPKMKKAPSKVMVAAAMFENPGAGSATGAADNGTGTRSGGKGKKAVTQRPKLSPASSSFRSIAAGKETKIPTPGKLSSNPGKLSKSPTGANDFLSKSPKAVSPLSTKKTLSHSPKAAPPTAVEAIETPPATAARAELFSDVALTASTPDSPAERPAGTPPRDIKLSPIPPRPVDLPIISPGEDAIPSTVSENKSYFASALGLGSSPSSGQTGQSPSDTVPSTNEQPTGQGGSAGGWRSTMNHFLTRSTSGPSSQPISISRTPSPLLSSKIPSPPTQPTPSLSPSAALLLHRGDATPSRDRRLSKDLSPHEPGQESFNRVRGEMDGAAREMRREREGKRTPVGANGSSGGNSHAVHAIIEEEEDDEVDWTFWGSVVQDYEAIATSQPKLLSKAIQQGIPPVIRGAVWQLMSSSNLAILEETYKALLKLPSPHEKAIIKDLNRTFPNHKYFKEGGGVGQEGLFMVVKAYSLYDQEVGYTQGLAFIVAALLLNMPDEEAFCVLVRLMNSYNLRSHYTAEMQGLQLRLFQFDRLVEDILPLIHTHFVRKGVKSSMYASQWFMTLFSYRLPLSLVYRVFDIVFAEGIEAVFRFSLALLKRSETTLVQLEFEEILTHLQTDLFEVYRVPSKDGEGGHEATAGGDDNADESWKANEFVRDAFEIRITPLMLDAYASEWEEQCRNQNRHAAEVDQLRNINRNLSGQVKQLEASLAAMNQEHVELVRQLVMSKIDKEETENELVRYKMLYAELAHAQQDALSVHSRLSASSGVDSRQTSTPGKQ